jgi:hypothetical protein
MKNIKMISVESSNVKCVGYDEENKNIHIQLKSGEHYLYQDVPKKVFEDLLKATSIGSYINRYLKDSYKLVSENSFYALQKASEPLVEYLKKYYCPHTQILVSWDFVKVLQDEMGIPVGTAQEVPVQEQQIEKENALNYLANSFSESNHNFQLAKNDNSQSD